MKIYLIRHGQTTGDIEDRYGGDYDDELTDKGKAQASILADELAGSGIQAIFCSPKIRAQQTAEIVNSKLNCEIKTVEDLRERNQNGVLTGMVRSEAKQKYPQMVEEVKNYKNTIKGAEANEDFEKRIKKVFIDISNLEGYSTIGIVTHGGPIRVVFRVILGNDDVKSIADCAYAIFDKTGNTLNIKKLNGIDLQNS